MSDKYSSRGVALILLITVAFFAIELNGLQSWTPLPKSVDVAIVIDTHPLQDAARFDWYDNMTRSNRTTVYWLLEEAMRPLLETRKYEADTRFAILFHKEAHFHVAVTLDQGTGRSVKEVMRALGSLKDAYNITKFPRRPNREEEIVSEARSTFASVPGNRRGVPDFIIWFAMHNIEIQLDPEPAMKDLRRLPNAPDLVVAMASTQSIGNVRAAGNGINTQLYGLREIGPKITESILTSLQSCVSEVRNSSCFFESANGPCQYETIYKPPQGISENDRKYCMDLAISYPCENRGHCQTACDNYPHRVDVRPCSVTCGQGVKYTRPQNADADKYLQHCPEKQEPCFNAASCSVPTEVSPPASATTIPPSETPSTTTTTQGKVRTTTKKKPSATPAGAKTSPTSDSTTDTERVESTAGTESTTTISKKDGSLAVWEIILISIGVLLSLIVAIIVCFLICLCRKRKDKSTRQAPAQWDRRRGGRSYGPSPHYLDMPTPRSGSPSNRRFAAYSSTPRYGKSRFGTRRAYSASLFNRPNVPGADASVDASISTLQPSPSAKLSKSRSRALPKPSIQPRSSQHRSSSKVIPRTSRTQRTSPSSLHTASLPTASRPMASRPTTSRRAASRPTTSQPAASRQATSRAAASRPTASRTRTRRY